MTQTGNRARQPQVLPPTPAPPLELVGVSPTSTSQEAGFCRWRGSEGGQWQNLSLHVSL